MITMTRTLATEFLKLRRSMALLLTLGAPMMIPAFLLMVTLSGNVPETSNSWIFVEMQSRALWAVFLLPMTATALAILLAQIEHGAQGWSSLFTLPQQRWTVFLSKMSVAVSLLILMSVLLIAGVYTSGALAGLITPENRIGSTPDPLGLTRSLGMILIAALPLVAIQMWTAMRFKSYVPPIMLGIFGTFIAVAASGSEYGIYWPWLLPVNAVANDPDRPMQAVLIGATIGPALALLAIIHLTRREAA